jgi:amino acid transporter
MKTRVILQEDSLKKATYRLMVGITGYLLFILGLMFDSTREILWLSLWPITSAVFSCVLCLTGAALLLERKTGERIKRAYSKRQIPWTTVFAGCTTIVLIDVLIEIFSHR